MAVSYGSDESGFVKSFRLHPRVEVASSEIHGICAASDGCKKHLSIADGR
jgi:hypothetical protein